MIELEYVDFERIAEPYAVMRELYRSGIESQPPDSVSEKERADILRIIDTFGIEGNEKYFEVRDKAFQFAQVGEEAGFIRGFKLAMELGRELYSDK